MENGKKQRRYDGVEIDPELPKMWLSERRNHAG
jgi:hypothetical protein